MAAACGISCNQQDQDPLTDEGVAVTGTGLQPRSALSHVEAAMCRIHLACTCALWAFLKERPSPY